MSNSLVRVTRRDDWDPALLASSRGNLGSGKRGSRLATPAVPRATAATDGVREPPRPPRRRRGPALLPSPGGSGGEGDSAPTTTPVQARERE